MGLPKWRGLGGSHLGGCSLASIRLARILLGASIFLGRGRQHIVVLDIPLHWIGRQILFGIGIAPQPCPQLGDVRGRIIFAQRLLLLGGQTGVRQAAVALLKGLHGLHCHPAIGERDHLAANRIERRLQGDRLGGPQALQVVLHGGGDGRPRRLVADPADRQNRAERDGQHQEDEPRLNTQSVESEHAPHSESGPAVATACWRRTTRHKNPRATIHSPHENGKSCVARGRFHRAITAARRA